MKSGIIYKFNFYFELACTDIGGSNEPCEMAGEASGWKVLLCERWKCVLILEINSRRHYWR